MRKFEVIVLTDEELYKFPDNELRMAEVVLLFKQNGTVDIIKDRYDYLTRINRSCTYDWNLKCKNCGNNV